MYACVQADLWPEVRSAAARGGRVIEAAVTAAYVADLVRDCPGAECQRVADAVAALTMLLQSGLVSAGDGAAGGGAAGSGAAVRQLQAELEALLLVLADAPPATPELEALMAAASAEAGTAGRRRRQQRVVVDGISRWASAEEAARWLQAARPAEVVQAVRVAAQAASTVSEEPPGEIQEAVFAGAVVRVRPRTGLHRALSHPLYLGTVLAHAHIGRDPFPRSTPVFHRSSESVASASHVCGRHWLRLGR